jgi:hypothetical protein
MFTEDCSRKRAEIRLVTVLVMGFAGLVLSQLFYIALANASPGEPQRQLRIPRPKRVVKPEVPAKKPRVDYARFSHSTHVTQENLTCDSCHKFPTKNWKEVRKGDEAFPDVTEYPEHRSCLNCHRKQFFARERPVPRICYNCHFNATPVETSRYPFPSLGEKFLSSAKAMDFVSDFRVFFPHDKHLDVISRNLRLKPDESGFFVRASLGRRFAAPEDSDPKSCAICHQTYQPQGKSDDEFVTKAPKDIGDSFWLKKGSFKTRPTTHAACFTCHNQESELAPLPQDCDACHKFPPPSPPSDFDPLLSKKIGIDDWGALTAWRSRYSSGAFRHEVHADLSCTKCHNPAMNTVDVSTLKVPVGSCGGAEGCHVTATADDGGILNYELDQRKTNERFVCVKCHIVFGSKPSSASHLEAIVKAASK